ncbi:hypothetical protein BHE74_00012288 [Ensete ventricosum]|nr:hypothetical protein BHE74_00012288 [Ensete ventricosum]
MAVGGCGGCLQVAMVEVVAAKVQLRQRKEEAVEGTIVVEEGTSDGSGRALLAGFVQQEIAAGYDQGRWRREIAAGSVV